MQVSGYAPSAEVTKTVTVAELTGVTVTGPTNVVGGKKLVLACPTLATCAYILNGDTSSPTPFADGTEVEFSTAATTVVSCGGIRAGDSATTAAPVTVTGERSDRGASLDAWVGLQ